MGSQTLLNNLKGNPGLTTQLKVFTQITAIPLRLIDSKGKTLWKSDFFRSKSNFCNFLQSNGLSTETCLRVHKEAAKEALRWGEAIISKCCYFIMQITAPVIKEGKLVGNLVASPFLLVYPSELQPEELGFLHSGKQKRERGLEKALSSVPIVKDEEGRQAAHHLFQLADRLSDPNLSGLIKVRESQALQGKIADQICDLKNFDRAFIARPIV